MTDEKLEELIRGLATSHASCRATVEQKIVNFEQKLDSFCIKLEKLTNGQQALQNKVLKLSIFMGVLGGGIGLMAKELVKRLMSG